MKKLNAVPSITEHDEQLPETSSLVLTSVLTLRGPTDKLTELARELKIETDKSLPERREWIHLHCADESLGHKQKAIQIFTFAVVARLKQKCDMLLWENHPSQDRLERDMKEEHIPAALPSLDLVNGLVIDAAPQIYLHQAGFDISPIDGRLHMPDERLRTLVKTVAQSTAQQNLNKKSVA